MLSPMKWGLDMSKSEEFSVKQYRCLVAHMSFWEHGIDNAMKDVGVSASKETVINELFKAGWDYDEKIDTIIFNDKGGSTTDEVGV